MNFPLFSILVIRVKLAQHLGSLQTFSTQIPFNWLLMVPSNPQTLHIFVISCLHFLEEPDNWPSSFLLLTISITVDRRLNTNQTCQSTEVRTPSHFPVVFCIIRITHKILNELSRLPWPRPCLPCRHHHSPLYTLRLALPQPAKHTPTGDPSPLIVIPPGRHGSCLYFILVSLLKWRLLKEAFPKHLRKHLTYYPTTFLL